MPTCIEYPSYSYMSVLLGVSQQTVRFIPFGSSAIKHRLAIEDISKTENEHHNLVKQEKRVEMYGKDWSVEFTYGSTKVPVKWDTFWVGVLDAKVKKWIRPKVTIFFINY